MPFGTPWHFRDAYTRRLEGLVAGNVGGFYSATDTVASATGQYRSLSNVQRKDVQIDFETVERADRSGWRVVGDGGAFFTPNPLMRQKRFGNWLTCGAVEVERLFESYARGTIRRG